MASEWHVSDGPALVCANCGRCDGLEPAGNVGPGEIPAEVHCFECGASFTVALIDEGEDPYNAHLGAGTPLKALLKARHESTPLPVVFGEGEDRSGNRWRVSGRAGWVRVEADAVDLLDLGQEKFAQAVLAACKHAEILRRAEVHGQAAGTDG